MGLVETGQAAASSPRDRVVFILPLHLTDYDVEVLGFRQFAMRGLRVEALVVPVMPRSSSSGPESVEGFPVSYVGVPGALDQAIGERAADSVFFDCAFGLGAPSLRGAPLYAALRAHRAVYCVVSAGALPPIPAPRGPAEKLWRIVSRASNLLSPRRAAEYFARKSLLAFSPDALSQPAPFRIYSGHSSILSAYLLRNGQSDSLVRWINSYDYDTYLGYVRSLEGATPASEPIAVFLDEAATSHRDFDLIGGKGLCLPEAEYSASMRRLFDAVERNTGLRVVVAAHPRSDYDNRPGFFGDRELVLGRTVDLVARSSFVIGHVSTAISYAVLFDKPLLLARTKEMTGSVYELGLAMMSDALSIRPLRVGSDSELDAADWDYPHWFRGAYGDYSSRYIHAPEAPAGMTTWEIVADDLVSAGVVVPRFPTA